MRLVLRYAKAKNNFLKTQNPKDNPIFLLSALILASIATWSILCVLHQRVKHLMQIDNSFIYIYLSLDSRIREQWMIGHLQNSDNLADYLFSIVELNIAF